MATELKSNCGGCSSRSLTIDHWKTCLGIQCKCLHYRRHHNKYDKRCKTCKCRGFEPILNFDEFYQWSKHIRPVDPIISKTGEVIRSSDLSPDERRILQGG